VRLAFCDVETNAIDNPDSIWLVGGKMACTGEAFKFDNIHTDLVARKAATEWHLSLDKMVGHNFISYGLPLLNKWLDTKLDPQKVLDTLVLSRTINFNIETPHHQAKFRHTILRATFAMIHQQNALRCANNT
jgi:hypothetical protein